MITFAVQYRGVEQLVARWAHNPKVAGSSPASATKLKESEKSGSFFLYLHFCKMLIYCGCRRDTMLKKYKEQWQKKTL